MWPAVRLENRHRMHECPPPDISSAIQDTLGTGLADTCGLYSQLHCGAQECHPMEALLLWVLEEGHTAHAVTSSSAVKDVLDRKLC